MKKTIKSKQELSGELVPSEGDKDLGATAWGIFEEAFDYKKKIGLLDKWSRNYELGRNHHWRNPSAKVPLVSANFLHAHRQRIVNTLTDQNPTFDIKPAGDADPVYCQLQLKVAQYWWSDQEQQQILEKSVLNGETYGCCIEKAVFNPEREFGLGEVEIEVVDPFHFAIYPVDCLDIQKAEAVFHYRPFPLRQVKRMWPDSADDIRGDDDYLSDLGRERIEVNPTANKWNIREKVTRFGAAIRDMVTSTQVEDNDNVLVVEMWLRDYSTDKEGNYLYPGCIRRIQMCNGGEVILSDMGNPSINPTLPMDQVTKTYLFDKYPFTLTQSNTDTSNPWGSSDFEQLLGIQEEIDKTISQITLLKDRTTRLKIINPRDSGVDNSAFTNAPGIINPKTTMQANGIRYMEFPKAPMDLAQILNTYRDLFFTVAGSFEMEQASSPGHAAIAYKAIAALLERAATMHKGKIRNYSKMIRERGRMFISLAQNWYTEERYVSWEENGEQYAYPITGPQLIIPTKLSVVSGSTMPVSRIQEREEALELFKMGAIDIEELLKRMDWPEWSKVSMRMKQGPLGEFIGKMAKMGLPERAQQVLSEVGGMEQREFERKMHYKEIPGIQEIMSADLSGQDLVAQAQAEESRAKVQEIMARTQLIMEQANTEKVEQQVKAAGVQFDLQKLEIEKARTVSDVKAREAELQINKATTVHQIKDRDRLRALDAAKLQEQAREADEKKVVEEKKIAKAPQTESAKKKDQGPYHEKGLSSNNKE